MKKKLINVKNVARKYWVIDYCKICIKVYESSFSYSFSALMEYCMCTPFIHVNTHDSFEQSYKIGKCRF